MSICIRRSCVSRQSGSASFAPADPGASQAAGPRVHSGTEEGRAQQEGSSVVPRAALTALFIAVVLVSPRAQPGPAEVLFRDITKAIGITFTHHAAPEKKYIVESMSGGVALFDFDNDGRLDIYFVNSLTVDTAGDPKSARSELYRNLGEQQVRRRHRPGRRRPSGLGHGRVHGRRRRRRLGGPVRHRPRRQQALSQQRRQGRSPTSPRRRGLRSAAGRRAAASPTTIVMATSTSSSAATSRST